MSKKKDLYLNLAEWFNENGAFLGAEPEKWLLPQDLLEIPEDHELYSAVESRHSKRFLVLFKRGYLERRVQKDLLPGRKKRAKEYRLTEVGLQFAMGVIEYEEESVSEQVKKIKEKILTHRVGEDYPTGKIFKEREIREAIGATNFCHKALAELVAQGWFKEMREPGKRLKRYEVIRYVFPEVIRYVFPSSFPEDKKNDTGATEAGKEIPANTTESDADVTKRENLPEMPLPPQKEVAGKEVGQGLPLIRGSVGKPPNRMAFFPSETTEDPHYIPAFSKMSTLQLISFEITPDNTEHLDDNQLEELQRAYVDACHFRKKEERTKRRKVKFLQIDAAKESLAKEVGVPIPSPQKPTFPIPLSSESSETLN